MPSDTDLMNRWAELETQHGKNGQWLAELRRVACSSKPGRLLGYQQAEYLLQLALAISCPETMLNLKQILSQIRHGINFRAAGASDELGWIYQTAVWHSRSEQISASSLRLTHWYINHIVESRRGVWDPTTGASVKVKDIINNIASETLPPTVSGPALNVRFISQKDWDHTAKARRIRSWYEEGKKWTRLVNAVGGPNVLLLLPHGANINPSLPLINASAYARLKHEEVTILVNIIKNLRTSTLPLLQIELCESFLYHRIPSKKFRHDQLQSIQGKHVPICLGSIELARPSYYNSGVYTHFMFLSWAGRPLLDCIDLAKQAQVVEAVTMAFKELHKLHVLHCDAEPRNILYNVTSGRPMIVDFERAECRSRQPLGTLSPNGQNRKRKLGILQKKERMTLQENWGLRWEQFQGLSSVLVNNTTVVDRVGKSILGRNNNNNYLILPFTQYQDSVV